GSPGYSLVVGVEPVVLVASCSGVTSAVGCAGPFSRPSETFSQPFSLALAAWRLSASLASWPRLGAVSQPTSTPSPATPAPRYTKRRRCLRRSLRRCLARSRNSLSAAFLLRRVSSESRRSAAARAALAWRRLARLVLSAACLALAAVASRAASA